MKRVYKNPTRTNLLRCTTEKAHKLTLFLLLAAACLPAKQITSTSQSPPGAIVWPPPIEITAVPVSGFVLNGLTGDTLGCEQVVWSNPLSSEQLGATATDPVTRQFAFELPVQQTVGLSCQLPGFAARQYSLTAGEAPLQQNILVFPTENKLEKEMIAKDVVSVFNDPVTISDSEWEIAIDIKKYLSDSLAFFVTGYYRYNVPPSLPELQKLIIKHPQQLGYMRITEQDTLSSLVIDNLINAIYSNANQLFGKLAGDSTFKKLHIDIVGYADDRTLNAIYVEDTIQHSNPDDYFPEKEIHIQTGENIDNKKLSQLRACYTMQGLQELFSQSEFYQQLVKNGKVDYRLFGSGISEIENKSELTDAQLNKKYAEARRATITLRGEHVQRLK